MFSKSLNKWRRKLRQKFNHQTIYTTHSNLEFLAGCSSARFQEPHRHLLLRLRRVGDKHKGGKHKDKPKQAQAHSHFDDEVNLSMCSSDEEMALDTGSPRRKVPMAEASAWSALCTA